MAKLFSSQALAFLLPLFACFFRPTSPFKCSASPLEWPWTRHFSRAGGRFLVLFRPDSGTRGADFGDGFDVRFHNARLHHA
eukprot:6182477-Pleurochrysis_carterae.AAC.1